MEKEGLTVRLRLQDLFVRYSTVYTAEMTSEIRQDRNDTSFSIQPSEHFLELVIEMNALQRLTGLLSSI